jgi:hypothetical protein
MKRVLAATAMVILTTSAFAWDDHYDLANKYRGTIDNDGSTRLRNYEGDTLRGHIDSDGYWRLRDQEGNTYRVKPRW